LQSRNGKLPTGQDGEYSDLRAIFTGLVRDLGVLLKVIKESEDDQLLQSVRLSLQALFAMLIPPRHLADHSTHFFPPTLAILGGLLAQDVLRALSKKDKPIANFLALDSMGGTGTVVKWGMGDAVDIEA
jgi:ubiquitin-like 1-activating enzyme E1 A